MIVVTAASSNHFGALRYMLESLRALKARVECYDLGLAPREVQMLPRWAGLFYHKFDFAAYPPHLNVDIAAGEYAWKPVIVAEVVERLRPRFAAHAEALGLSEEPAAAYRPRSNANSAEELAAELEEEFPDAN